MHMFFGIPQRYAVDIYGFYFEEYILGYLSLPVATQTNSAVKPMDRRLCQ